jgi:hypothetical protein
MRDKNKELRGLFPNKKFARDVVFERKLLVGSFISRIFSLVPDGSRWFQMVPDGSRWFQMVPDGSRWFQMVPDDCGECQCFDCQQSGTNWNKLKPPD